MTSTILDPNQNSALLDILSHAEVYSEIRDFREQGTLAKYGPPFDSLTGEISKSPSLQTLLSKFVLTLPGLRDVSRAFWQEHVYAIIEDFEKAELSESFDKGNLGIRKTLATAASVLIEYLVRGVFGGLEKLVGRDGYYEYDTTDSEDLSKGFRDFIHQAVYGDIIDDLMAKAAETDKLSEHLPVVQAAHEYILVK
jgi:PX-associated